jgi:hypothetical protein
MKTLFLLLQLCFAVFFLPISEAKSLIGFNDIPWESPINIVQQKLPQSEILDSCISENERTSERLRNIFKNEDASCNRLFINKYPISGFDFNMYADFSSEDKLKSVKLNFHSRKKKDNSSSGECAQVYKQMLSLLEIKYGTSLLVSNKTPSIGFKNVEMRAWVMLPTVIYLSFSHGKIFSEFSKSCEVDINYNNQIFRDMDKL